MDRTQLLQHFETLAETPDAVEKLRAFVFVLAVRGLLVPQNNKDESGTELLKRILDEKRRLIRESVIKKTPALEPITADAYPFVIPKNWAWAYLNDFGDWGSGSTPNRTNHEFYDGTIPWLKSGELNDGIVSESEEKVTELALEKCSLRLNKPGDVLFAMYGATVGKVAILGIEATTNQAVCACTCFGGVFNRYLFVLLKAFKQQFISESAGAAQPNFSKDKIIRTIAPLPPLAEQRRIVAKVDELLALCDALEEAQTAAREHRTRLVRSALDHLTTAKDESDFKKHSAFIFQHSDFVLDDVPTLRQAILSLAVQGHLVARIKTEGTAEKLLKEIGAEALTPEDAPFIPAHWSWAGLGQLVTKMDSGWSPACPAEPASENAWGVLRTTAVQTLRYLEHENKALPENLEPRPEHEVMKGDMLITRAGPKNRVGISCVVETTRPRLMISDKIVRFRLHPLVDPRFGALCLNAGYTSLVLERLKSGMAESQMNISQGKFKTTPLPIPPLAEQQRIVAKVAELLRWCDALEARLIAARSTATHLLDATLHQILTA